MKEDLPLPKKLISESNAGNQAIKDGFQKMMDETVGKMLKTLEKRISGLFTKDKKTESAAQEEKKSSQDSESDDKTSSVPLADEDGSRDSTEDDSKKGFESGSVEVTRETTETVESSNIIFEDVEAEAKSNETDDERAASEQIEDDDESKAAVIEPEVLEQPDIPAELSSPNVNAETNADLSIPVFTSSPPTNQEPIFDEDEFHDLLEEIFFAYDDHEDTLEDAFINKVDMGRKEEDAEEDALHDMDSVEDAMKDTLDNNDNEDDVLNIDDTTEVTIDTQTNTTFPTVTDDDHHVVINISVDNVAAISIDMMKKDNNIVKDMEVSVNLNKDKIESNPEGEAVVWHLWLIGSLAAVLVLALPITLYHVMRCKCDEEDAETASVTSSSLSLWKAAVAAVVPVWTKTRVPVAKECSLPTITEDKMFVRVPVAFKDFAGGQSNDLVGFVTDERDRDMMRLDPRLLMDAMWVESDCRSPFVNNMLRRSFDLKRGRNAAVDFVRNSLRRKKNKEEEEEETPPLIEIE